ncbi:hypothetical protein GUY44_07630 [Pimelobacter simplex]|uniref:Phage protein n=1 Tax=Nocardioides simplex TaxID=2045 RepID=A0A0C5XKJ6_NOCSI|nr:hypothetical protein [Pimelobacter simplex]AJR18022.1 Phage protein [Pimelobacter simplex]MCG8150345.1 hypothetical protein [Pimelobacter simplex]GEB16712.1 hypothetical protein NSI01_50270 [Pimelobacter simplex]SFM89645.1 hypothetical protein SAMN05421671_4073 [Pimelobacter simplex]
MTDTTTEGDGDAHVRPFADWLREQAGGKSHDELSDAVYDLVQRVKDTGKKGSLVYTINIGPMKGDKDVLMIDDQIKLKLPEHDRKASLFYTDKVGNLTRTDPNQLVFESLREVEGGQLVDVQTGELREVT